MIIILEAVNPGVTTDKAALVRNSVAVCGRITAGASTAEITALTQRLFTHGRFTPQGGEITAIDMAITRTFCR